MASILPLSKSPILRLRWAVLALAQVGRRRQPGPGRKLPRSIGCLIPKKPGRAGAAPLVRLLHGKDRRLTRSGRPSIQKKNSRSSRDKGIRSLAMRGFFIYILKLTALGNGMSLNTYRQALQRSNEAISRLQSQKARELAKIADYSKRRLAATDAARKTKQASTINFKLHEASRHADAEARAQKRSEQN